MMLEKFLFRNHTTTIAQLEAEKAEMAAMLSMRIAELFAENQQLHTDFEQFRTKVQTDRQTAEDIVARTNARAEAYLVQTRQKVAEIESLAQAKVAQYLSVRQRQSEDLVAQAQEEATHIRQSALAEAQRIEEVAAQKADEYSTQIRNDAIQEAERVRENSRVATENTRADISEEWTKLSERQAQMDQLIQVAIDAEHIRAEARSMLVDATEQKRLAEEMVQVAKRTAEQLEQEAEEIRNIEAAKLETLIVATLDHCSTIVLQQALDGLDEAEYAQRDAYCKVGHILDDATVEAAEIIQKAQEEAVDIIVKAKAKAKKKANRIIAEAEDKEECIKDRAFRYLIKFINDRNYWSDDLVCDRKWLVEDCLRLDFPQQDEIWADPEAYGDDDTPCS